METTHAATPKTLLMLGLAATLATLASWSPTAALSFAVGSVALPITFLRPTTALWVVFGGMLLFSGVFAMRGYDVGLSIFGVDLFFVILFALMFWDPRARSIRPFGPLSKAIFAMALYGVFATFYAIKFSDHALRDIVGDYRRLFLYPLVFFEILMFGVPRVQSFEDSTRIMIQHKSKSCP